MSRSMLAIIIAIVIVAIVVLLYYLLVVLPSQKLSQSGTSQALTVSSVSSIAPSSSPTPVTITGIPFYVHSGSFLANFIQMPLTVAAPPIFVGDSVWLILQLPNGNYVTEVMDVVAAEGIGVGTTITNGSIITPLLA